MLTSKIFAKKITIPIGQKKIKRMSSKIMGNHSKKTCVTRKAILKNSQIMY